MEEFFRNRPGVALEAGPSEALAAGVKLNDPAILRGESEVVKERIRQLFLIAPGKFMF